jgi:hypothetical protein
MPALPELIAGYASRMHSEMTGHHILSPLGAWLLLALVGPAAQGPRRESLETVLGTDVESAAAHAGALLADPHPAVSTATAFWHLSAVDTPALDAWSRSLPEVTERGDIPSQADADAWAARLTRELIRTFPLEISADTVLLLATALAARISWRVPFTLAGAGELGPAWGPDVQHVLRSAVMTHQVFLADTSAGGCGVHIAGSESGLDVVSVVAEESHAPSAVIAAAHEVATGAAPELALDDLPLGTGHAWTLAERAEPAPDHQRSAVLPAWHASTKLDLLAAGGLGFGPAAEALMALLPPGLYGAEAAQSAVAAYTRTGFEAAAITALRILRSARAPRPGVRDLEVRFTRPYAVVAIARGPVPAAWQGLPVFSGWVERADNAT